MVSECVVCGAETRGHRQYCPDCRYSLKHGSSRPPSSADREFRRGVAKIVAYLFLALFVVIGLVLLFSVLSSLILNVWGHSLMGRLLLLSAPILVSLIVTWKITSHFKPDTDAVTLRKKAIFFVVMFFLLLAFSFFYIENKSFPTKEEVSPAILSSNLSIKQNTNFDCYYKEKVDISEDSQVCKTYSQIENYTWFVYDYAGNRYETPIEVKNLAGGQGRISFDLVNTIPLAVSIKVNYDTSHSGGSFWPNSEEFHEIGPLETYTVVNTGTSGISWGSSSVSNIRVSYLTNNYTSAKIDKKIISYCIEYKKKQIDSCKLCAGAVCLNDGSNCAKNSECGSGVCNLAKICGLANSSFVVDCPVGLQNFNNYSFFNF